MASPERRAYSSLEELLFERGYQFDFYQAVRIALRLSPGGGVGSFLPPSREAVRFHLHSSLTSPSSIVRTVAKVPPSKLRDPKSQELIHITTAALGLTGFSGVMPLIYTDLLIKAAREKNPAVAEFLDLFNHRLISLQYRGWEKRRLHIPFERESTIPIERRKLSSYLLSFMGMGGPSLLRRLEMPDHHLLRHTGLLVSARRSASALRNLLVSCLNVAVQIQQFFGMWCALSPSEILVLQGRSESTQLGAGAVIGRAVWYPQASFRVSLGPIPFAEFLSFLPGSRKFSDVWELTNHFTEAKFETFQIQFLLCAHEVPDCQLTRDGRVPPLLGWTTWLKHGSQSRLAEGLRTVVFRSGEPAAQTRHRVICMFKDLQAEAERRYKLKTTWSENSVSWTMSELAGRRSAQTQTDGIAVRLAQSMESQVKSGGFKATEVRIELESGDLQCKVT